MYISDLSVNTLSFLNKNENKIFLFDYDTVETLFFFSMPSTNSDMESMITNFTNFFDTFFEEFVLRNFWRISLFFQHANYEFGYGVDDYDAYGNTNKHSRHEVREGKTVKGKCRVKVHIFWEDHKIWRNLQTFLTINAILI